MGDLFIFIRVLSIVNCLAFSKENNEDLNFAEISEILPQN